jgi:hypothetical protein
LSFRRSEPKPKEMVEQYNRKEPWILWLGAALALHALLLALIPHLPAPKTPSPRVEVTQIDPSQLESLKRQWKEKALLLSKNPEAPKDNAPPPENARYSSDRNRTVERETRAEQTDVLPQPGRPGAPGTENTPEAQRQPAGWPSAVNARPVIQGYGAWLAWPVPGGRRSMPVMRPASRR